MTFFQRAENSLLALTLANSRDFDVFPKLEAIIDEKFPNDLRGSRPTLLELEQNAGLAFQVLYVTFQVF